VTVTSAETTLTVIPPLPFIITPRDEQAEVVAGSLATLKWTAVGAVAASEDTAPNMTVYRIPFGRVLEKERAPVHRMYVGESGFGLAFRTIDVQWKVQLDDHGAALFAVAKGACMTNECDLPKAVLSASLQSLPTVLRVVEGENVEL